MKNVLLMVMQRGEIVKKILCLYIGKAKDLDIKKHSSCGNNCTSVIEKNVN